MGLFENISKIFKRNNSVAGRSWQDIKTLTEPMTLSGVYRCVDVISDGIASLPLRLYKWENGVRRRVWQGDKLGLVLNTRPDERMTRYDFIKMLVVNKFLHGNAYAYIVRDEATPRFVLLNSGDVTPIGQVDERTHQPYVVYQVKGFERRLQHDELIHIKNFGYNGLVGVSTLRHAFNALNIAGGGDRQASKFYDGNGQPSGVVSIESGGRLKEKDRNEFYKVWDSRLRDNPGGVIVLEGNAHYQPIGVNPADAQLLESRQFSVVEICRFFGVSPVKCFDLSKSSYSTVEATQLDFLNDTLRPIMEAIEQELNSKLFLGDMAGRFEVRFDTSSLLRADKTAQANYYRTLIFAGVLTPNEVRAEIDRDPIDGGDRAYVQNNMVGLNDVGKEL
jgi:HK97 family phage portal protein